MRCASSEEYPESHPELLQRTTHVMERATQACYSYKVATCTCTPLNVHVHVCIHLVLKKSTVHLLVATTSFRAMAGEGERALGRRLSHFEKKKRAARASRSKRVQPVERFRVGSLWPRLQLHVYGKRSHDVSHDKEISKSNQLVLYSYSQCTVMPSMIQQT